MRNVQLLQAGSQQRAPLHCPRMFGHWVTQPSALTHLSLSFCSYFFLSPSRLHTLFSETMCPWGAYAMQRSNTNFTACARYNLIFSAGEMEEWAKKTPHKQTTQVFLTTARWKFPPHPLSIWFDFIEGVAAQTLNLCTLHLFFFCIGYSQKKTQKHRCWLDLPLQRFLKSNHFRIQMARLQQRSRNFLPSADETPAMNSLMAVIMTQ